MPYNVASNCSHAASAELHLLTNLYFPISTRKQFWLLKQQTTVKLIFGSNSLWRHHCYHVSQFGTNGPFTHRWLLVWVFSGNTPQVNEQQHACLEASCPFSPNLPVSQPCALFSCTAFYCLSACTVANIRSLGLLSIPTCVTYAAQQTNPNRQRTA